MKLKPCPFCGGEAINDHDSHPIYCGSCYMSMPYGVCENDMVSLWNTRIAEWISVRDKLPAIDEIVIVWKSSKGFALSRTAVCQFNKYGFEMSCVTHWMPLPSIPIMVKI